MNNIEKLFKADLVSECTPEQIVDWYLARCRRAIELKLKKVNFMIILKAGGIYYCLVGAYNIKLDTNTKIIDCECLDFIHRGLKLLNTEYSWAVSCKHSLYAKLMLQKLIKTIDELNN